MQAGDIPQLVAIPRSTSAMRSPVWLVLKRQPYLHNSNCSNPPWETRTIDLYRGQGYPEDRSHSHAVKPYRTLSVMLAIHTNGISIPRLSMRQNQLHLRRLERTPIGQSEDLRKSLPFVQYGGPARIRGKDQPVNELVALPLSSVSCARCWKEEQPPGVPQSTDGVGCVPGQSMLKRSCLG